MARKTTGTTTTRSKKAAATPEPVVTQTVPVLSAQEHVHREDVRHEDVRKTVAIPAPAPKNGAAKNGATLDEEIRHRAYELYLERNGAVGDPTADWFVAEREVRARHATAGR